MPLFVLWDMPRFHEEGLILEIFAHWRSGWRGLQGFDIDGLLGLLWLALRKTSVAPNLSSLHSTTSWDEHQDWLCVLLFSAWLVNMIPLRAWSPLGWHIQRIEVHTAKLVSGQLFCLYFVVFMTSDTWTWLKGFEATSIKTAAREIVGNVCDSTCVKCEQHLLSTKKARPYWILTKP